METKKRILVFIPEFPVLTETFIEREISKLVERGNVDLTIFSLAKGRGSLSENLKDRIVYDRARIKDIFITIPYYFSNFSHINKVFWEFRKRHRELNKKNEGCEEISLFKEIYAFVKSVLYAKKFLECKPDLLLAHFLSEPSTIVMNVSAILNVPYGISAHAKDILVTAEYIREKVQTSEFITICNKNAYYYVLQKSQGLDTGRVYLKYHGVDVQNIIKKVENINLKSEKPTILAVGRLVEKKGLKYLVEAARILKSRSVVFTINIIGSGPLYSEILDSIKTACLEDEVKVLGDNKGLSNEETLAHYKSASVFAFPSIRTDEGDVDGVSNVLMEAGIFKLPVVTTDAGGIGEIISDEKTGLVVSQKNPEELSDKIELILNDSEFGKRLGENLYSKVLEKFDLNKNIVELENLLK